MEYKYQLKVLVHKTSGLLSQHVNGNIFYSEICIESDIDKLINENGTARLFGHLPLSETHKMPFDEIISINNGIAEFNSKIKDKTIIFKANIHNLFSSQKINDVRIEIINHGLSRLLCRSVILAGYATQIIY